MVQPQFDIVLCINADRPQVLVGVGNNDELIFLEVCQELPLMRCQVSLFCSLMEEVLQSFQEVIDAIVNLLWW